MWTTFVVFSIISDQPMWFYECMDDAIKILSQEEIEEGLMHLPEWKYEADMLSKEFVFASFSDGLNLIDQLAPFCNRINHHPDIHIYYKKIRFDLHLFDIGGKVTNKDIQIAVEIERLFAEYQRSLED